ncbi:proline--tRNA ligase [Helicobacter sp. MIT 14-3879]|uniref:proline--tRNA ligase n=1 Tax=Helicobacter sp. MIT 14-3879 TaxID=2040649 RepID=UPI000E1F220D|nr:proline--tRNA ligase [Helicobacter sp. MIT 14-3879]RDU62615.1 proline--tRNA ligase [Helicobacter sp. MIT 14-3879]
MKFSKLFAFSTKEEPKDCVLKSHNYLIRGGYIKQIGSGIYSFLPLGQIVLSKIKKIIKEEMDKSGANEVTLGFVTPAELWIKSKRFNKYGKELLTFKDRKENLFILGPTHEESITDSIKGYIKSYKQLPLNLYQINIKFRDEIRPRFGLMRAREFIMKDAYSFHSSKEDLDREFNLMEQTYRNIFNRIGVDFRVVEADSGAIGGSGSKEFMILAQSGEDEIIICKNCDYAANVEAATRSKRIIPTSIPKAEFAKFYTPSIDNVNKLSEFFKIDSYFILKCVAKKVIFEGNIIKYCFFFIRGCDELSNTKAFNSIPDALELQDLSKEEINSIGLFCGFIGPYGLKNIIKSDYIYFDNELKDCTDLICGANEKDYHFVGVDLSKFKDLNYKDLVEIKAGDLCPKCTGILTTTRGIEIGHIFKLGNRYSKPLEATFLNKDGKAEFFEMGCYGIGISRILPSILEQKADSKGAIWGNVPPFEIVIIISNIKNINENNFATKIYKDLLSLNAEVLLDDRDCRFGAKMADFELMGFKYALIIGKELQNNNIELIKRVDLSKITLSLNTSPKDILDLIKE